MSIFTQSSIKLCGLVVSLVLVTTTVGCGDNAPVGSTDNNNRSGVENNGTDDDSSNTSHGQEDDAEENEELPNSMAGLSVEMIVGANSTARYIACSYKENGLLMTDSGWEYDAKSCFAFATHTAIGSSMKRPLEAEDGAAGVRFIAERTQGEGEISLVAYRKGVEIDRVITTEDNEVIELRYGNQDGQYAEFPGWSWRLRRDPGLAVKIDIDLHSESKRSSSLHLDSEFEYEAGALFYRMPRNHTGDWPEIHGAVFQVKPEGEGSYTFEVYHDAELVESVTSSNDEEISVGEISQ